MPEFSLAFFGRLLFCYACGSIPFAVLAMRGSGVDILKSGSGNPGFNNVLRHSKWRAVLTLIGDFGKGFLPVWLCHEAGGQGVADWMYGFAAIAGHCYSPFLKFNGGKGIATSAGVMLYLYPLLAAVGMGFFVVVRLIGARRRWPEAGTLASISGVALFVVLLLLNAAGREALMGFVLLLFVAWRHRKNFLNLARPAQAG